MTAEVVILNRMAVALAADSAVTIGDSKIYNTVNKLFTLSKHHPVGIMIFGNAQYMGIPWETVIKVYRENLGRKKLDTLQAYTRNFLRFLVRKFKITRDLERQRIVQIWWAYFRELNDQCRSILLDQAKNAALTQTDVNRLILAVIQAKIAALKGKKTLPQYRRLNPSSIWKRYRKEFDDVRAATLAGRHLTAFAIKKLQEYAGLILVKNEFNHTTSGLVFAGFGDKEIFPSVCPVSCAGKLLGHLKVQVEPRNTVTANSNEGAFIGAFAQKEMVYRFMEGIDPTYSNYLRHGIQTLMQNLSDRLITKSQGSVTARAQRAAHARKVVSKMVDDFEKNALLTRHLYFVRPILNIVALLPKDELAELAWSLVNITSLKRKISMDAETVGGPIDVAVISKGDGFIWIRRKHYFQPELNPSYLQRYLEVANNRRAR
jgi:hypothetical protein